jgi:hypothetical protein
MKSKGVTFCDLPLPARVVKIPFSMQNLVKTFPLCHNTQPHVDYKFYIMNKTNTWIEKLQDWF